MPPGELHLTLLPGDPPRTARFAWWGRGGDDQVELAVPPAGKPGAPPRRRTVPATVQTLSDALRDLLLDGAESGPDATVWSAASAAGAGLIARGKLLPTVSPEGWDAWMVGPLDPADEDLLHALAAALPPPAHAAATGAKGPGRQLEVPDPEWLIRHLWDAMADTLVRTPAAAATTSSPAFADGTGRSKVADLAPWLTQVEAESRPLPGAILGLRLELPDGPDGTFWAALQLRARADPSLVVELADLWDLPATVLRHLGAQAETDALVALRRGARVWPPMERLLAQARPEAIELDDDEVHSLLGPATDALTGAGLEVMWPTEMAAAGLELRAVGRASPAAGSRATPAPQAVAGGGLSADQLVQFDWEVALGGQPLTREEMTVLAEAKRPLVRLRGRWVTADPELVQRLARRTRRSRSLKPAEALAGALAGEITDEGDVVPFTVEGPLAALTERLRAGPGRSPQAPAVAPPAGLRATLRPYQLRGLAWLAEMCGTGLGGCLADDMGLGKTVQLIALHVHRHEAPGVEPRRPTLVVCPASLLGNWEREVARFAPSVPVRRYHGAGRHRHGLRGLHPDEIVLVTYGLVRRDRSTLAEVEWGLVVADEAQHVKNPLAGAARALRALPAQARVALTGTPVENRLSDLWAILDWTTPGLLGTLDGFRRAVAVPVERYHDEAATERLARIVRPFLLRRKKTDPGVAPELPAKTETDVVVPLTPEQVTLYEAVVREALATIAAAEGMARRGMVLRMLTALKQVCNHPAHYLGQAGPLAGRSGKLEALEELLGVIRAEGDAALVFTQYVGMGKLLERHLGAEFLHGSLPVRRRDELVDRFQAGEIPVLVISLRAGGVGLNLTRASHVVHYDRWWNPAVEDQATDRAYRIGQDHPVMVHRLIAEGTLEDKIAALLQAKRGLADAVVGTGEGWLSELGDDDLADLVSLQREAS